MHFGSDGSAKQQNESSAVLIMALGVIALGAVSVVLLSLVVSVVGTLIWSKWMGWNYTLHNKDCPMRNKCYMIHNIRWNVTSREIMDVIVFDRFPFL